MKTNIKELRLKQGLTKYALAIKSGVSRQYIALIEKEEHAPSICVLVKISNALNVPINELIDIKINESVCEHKNITRSDGLDECLDCGIRNY